MHFSSLRHRHNNSPQWRHTRHQIAHNTYGALEERKTRLARDLLHIFFLGKGVPLEAPRYGSKGKPGPEGDFEDFLSLSLEALPKASRPPTLDSMRENGLLQNVHDQWRKQLADSIASSNHEMLRTMTDLPPQSRHEAYGLMEVIESQVRTRSASKKVAKRPRGRPKQA